MLSFLHGTILSHTKDGAIVRVGDLGYEVIGTWLGRESIGTTLDLYTYQYFENQSLPRLIATINKEAREFLIELMTVQGVGPKMASRILDTSDISKLKNAITQGDLTTLRTVKGLGLKTAQKIILELGKKLVDDQSLAHASIYEALKELGFNKNEIDKAITKTDLNNLNENDSITAVLKNLGRAK